MQRELARLNSQIRRALARFNEELGQFKKCDDKLRFGCDQARTSIVDIASGLVCLIKEKEKQLLKELDDFQQSEEINLKKLREGVDEEYNNLIANCELIEKNVLNYSASKQANQSNLNLNLALEEDDQNDLIQWSDLELVEYREIFLKTLEFLRNFETLDSMEYARSGIKLDIVKDLDQVRKQAANYASLKVQYLATEKLQLQQQMIAQLAAGIPLGQAGSPNLAQQLGSTHALNQTGTTAGQLNIPSQQSILMRSQSDHRLAAQFAKKELLKQQQSSKYGTNLGSNYDENELNNQYGVGSYYGQGSQTGPTQYRSRFMREKNAELHDTDDPYAAHRVRFDEQQLGVQNLTAAQLAVQLQNAFKVFDTKDASRCPLSSIVKLNESMHLMERIEENKRKAKKLEKEKAELKAMSQPPKTQPTQNNPISQINNLSIQQSPIQTQHQTNLTSNQPLQQNKAPPNRQISEDEIDKQKRLNKQFEMQSLNNNLVGVNNTNINTTTNTTTTTTAQPVQLVNQPQQQPQQHPTQQPKQVLQKQNSIHGPTESSVLQHAQLNKNLLSNPTHHHHQTRLNQTSSGPDDEEDEEIEDSVDEDSDEDDEDNANLPGHHNNRQVISSTTKQQYSNNKLSGQQQQRPSFQEESESKLMPVSALNDHQNEYANKNSSRRLSNSFEQQPNSLMNIGRTSSIDRDYNQSNSNSGNTSAGNKLSRQNSANSSSANQANHSLITPRNSIDIGSTGYNSSSRTNSFDRENGTSGYRYLTRANTRLDDLLNRDSYSNDNSSTSSNHNRFNRFNRLARSSTVSSLSPSYTGTSSSNNVTSSTGSNSSGSSNYRTYDLDNTSNNYLTGTSGYSSNRASNTDSGNSYLSIRSRPSSPPPQSRLSSTGSTNLSSLSRYGIGNSSVGTSSGYRRSSAYTPDTSENEEFKYKYKTRVPINRLLDDEKSSSIDTESIKNDRIKKIQLQKQYSLESNLKPVKNDDRKLKKCNTNNLNLATNKNVTFYRLEADDSDLTDKEEEEEELPKKIPNKIFDNADQILFKQKLEQRMNIYKNKGNLKLCIGKQGSENEFRWPKDVCWLKFTRKSKLLSEQILIVTDTGNSRVSCFDTQGKFINSFGNNGSEESRLRSPISACCLPDGSIIISDSNLNCLKFYDTECNFLKSIGNKNNQTTENKLNLNASRSNFNFFQNLTEAKSSASTKPGEFNSCYGLTYDPNQNELYVCDKDNQRVQVFDSNGNFKRFLNSNKSSTRLNLDNQLIFKNPNFIHSNGQFLIISDTSNHTIHRYNIKTGNTLILGGEGTAESKFKYPRGVAIDEFNFSIVADSGNNRIQIFKPDGSFHHAFGIYGKDEGQFKGIEGLSVDELGDIYVCDRENNRIQVF